ncbi:hypothetical protein [Hymenobacter cellulosilyticus]|uniref:Ig-like domain-containing protein n=1 Tax=Hymenobacter cellulosilyticus TaxID=2932248 RepID=A0A8T9Q134_9BACT|nr:hypothetical protein [Hymenobacter cellulosilyticus]UOQ71107.1 hypothetical protein MUN79_20910 [Hymenobacter cellulosilyticus]
MKHFLFFKALSALALTSGLALNHHVAYAQEDEPYFRKYWEARQKSSAPYKANPASPTLSAPTTDLRNGACDIAPNGDFEAQAFVPNRINNLNGGYPNAAETLNAPQGRSDLQQWRSATGGTPDYYATNATNDMAKPASAVYGPFTAIGTGSVGLFARQTYDSFDRVSEYVTASVSLSAGRYYAQFRANLTRNTSVANQGIASGFGIQFSNGNLPGASASMRDFLPPSGQGVLSTQPIGQNHIDNWNQAPISGQFDLPSGANTVTLGLFNSAPSALLPLPGRNASIPNMYVFVDDLQIFKVPTAGPDRACTGAPVQIGEGCAIPGATYAWTQSGSSTVLATTLQWNVRPTSTTTYNLTVRLPDGSTYSTAVTVNACPPCPALTDAPTFYLVEHAPNSSNSNATFDIKVYNTPGVEFFTLNLQNGNPYANRTMAVNDDGFGFSTFVLELIGETWYHTTVIASNSCSSVSPASYQYLHVPNCPPGGCHGVEKTLILPLKHRPIQTQPLGHLMWKLKALQALNSST